MNRTHPRRGRTTRRFPRLTLALAIVLAGLGLAPVASPPASAAAVDPCSAQGNKITCENSQAGTSSDVWDDQWGAGSDDIQGFSTDISVNVGNRVDFKIDTAATAYTVTIYRIGYYDGDGARRITTVPVTASLPQHQPACITDVTTELYDCGNWGVSASWQVPSTAVSGVYVARLEIPSSGAASQITFVVRDDSSHSDVVFQTSDTTWQAYNLYGGSNFYNGGANGRAYKVSYNRPMLTRGGTGGRDFFFANEYPLIRFLEKNGYDVSYQAGVDTDRRGHLLTNHKTFLSVGHDEYWSGAQRTNVEAARDAGVNLQFLSGNEVYWRTRYEPSADAGHTPYRTLVSYKETWDRRKSDTSSAQWTGTWRDPRYAAQSDGGGLPENRLIGTQYQVNHDDLAVKVSAAEGRLRLWRGTTLTSLAAGTTATLAPHTIGYESNEDVDNGFRPPGLVRLSTTNGPTPEYLTDYGNTVVPGTTTHHLTLYRAASGALVFSAGSVQWTWGLDAEHDTPFAPEPADKRMQQAQVNLLADMGAQPKTLSSDLTLATASTDTAAPTTSITSPTAGASRANGARLTVTGTATDTGGGRVAGIEVSTDDGDTWHPATTLDQLTGAWTYTAPQRGVGSETIRARAIDDSGNIGAATSRGVTVTCPCTVYGADEPQTAPADDSSGVELGLRFTMAEDGYLTGVRFFKGTGNGGTHVGSVWSPTGERLATATFGNETATGWQRVDFASPVAVAAGEQYVASYTAPNGRYSVETDAFSSIAWLRAPFRVPGGFGAPPSGVYGAPGNFPQESHANTGYFVEPVYSVTDSSPLTLVGRTPVAGSSSVPRGTKLTARFSRPVTPASATITLVDSAGDPVPGTRAYDAATRTVTFTPTAALAGGVRFTATAAGTDSNGLGLTGSPSWSFTTAMPAGAPGVCPCSLFSDDTVPGTEIDEPTAVTLGTRFTSDVAGTITAVRFHKGAGNTGTHEGAVWSGAGERLAVGTFTDESTAGWQTLVLAEPVEVTPGTEYIVSYRSPTGRYSLTAGAFSGSNLSRPPLRVDSTAGSFTYGTGFPSSRSSSSYLVDVVFERRPATIAIEAQDPPAGALEVPRNNPVRVWFSTPIQSGATLSATVAGQPVAGTAALSGDGTRLSFVPSALLPAASVVTVNLAGVRSTEGVVLADRSWTFTTEGPGAPAQTIFGDSMPTVPSDDSSTPVELGTAFVPSRDGTVRALRFLKGAGNGGTHVGTLWSDTGSVLARVTFANETPLGWQRARLSTPVRVEAGKRYVVSYLAPQGHYSYSLDHFAQPVTSGQLVAPAGDNGQFLYGASGGFPTYSFRSSSYFADVEYLPDPATITVSSRSPASGATDVTAEVHPSASFSVPVRPTSTIRVLVGGQPVAGTASLSENGRRLRFVPYGPLPHDQEVTVALSGVVSTDDAVLPDESWTFHTHPSYRTTVTMFNGMTPATASVNDSDPIEVGVAFTPDYDVDVTAIRFYKGPGNTGTHVGRLWSHGAYPQAQVVFQDETATGWQTAELSTPYRLTAGTTYVVSYYAPNGHYSATPNYFTGSSPLRDDLFSMPATDNGRYRYLLGGAYPTLSWAGTNYFVGAVLRKP
ncbi:DUF4082 domain-containing protein [Nocardioides sp. W7]|uniref:DUF4082 domain-containing protein n=1 Tax=Nocardioides sp. W7 TaxID=2931390 RepID=UPI001FD4D3EB|nr:DUF4082 domain-containing protein [Nocardioides sp. W7]